MILLLRGAAQGEGAQQVHLTRLLGVHVRQHQSTNPHLQVLRIYLLPEASLLSEFPSSERDCCVFECCPAETTGETTASATMGVGFAPS